MKRLLSVLLLIALLVSCFIVGVPNIYAAKKAEAPRAIAIVFDNSGSMYDAGDQAWCRATYAMEVFASMLNKGDVLQIYPMHPIVVGSNEYTMNSPFQITDASQATSIREILTRDAGGTPIESVDCAVNGLKALNFEKKYLIILTDGGTFSKNGNGLSKDRTKKELDQRIQANASASMNVMYLGIGTDASIPTTNPSAYFVKKQATNTADVLAMLTEMCNLIFGRDTLPKNRVTKNSMEFDISMSKLIVFVQGTDIANLKITSTNGGSVGTLVNTMQTKYSTKGAADYKSNPDTSLQGMIATYEDLDAGTYNIEYTGNATSVEVYYEPNADLDFVFTDSEGNTVDMNGLYEGEYKVSFGMKDAKTGKLIQSDLLGNPHYQGSYSINGQKTPITHDGYSGEVPVELHMNDTFEAELTVTYLSGYTISKSSADFGCPEGGVVVLAPPLGKFDMKLEAPQDYLLIGELEESKELTVDLTLGGKKLTPEEFKAVTLQVDCEGINYKVIPNENDSSFKIKLLATDGLKEGRYKINVVANYLDEQDRTASDSESTNVTLSKTPLWVKWTIGLLGLLLLLILIWIIAHIRVLPKVVKPIDNNMNYYGEDVTQDTIFAIKLNSGQMLMRSQYAGTNVDVVMNVKPGKESYLYKPQKKRSIEVISSSVRKAGISAVHTADIGPISYRYDEDKDNIVRDPESTKNFILKNGNEVSFSGVMPDASGRDREFTTSMKLKFTKR